MTIQMNNDHAWLTRLAEREEHGIVSAGGWVARSLEHDARPRRQPPRVFGQLVEFARRNQGLSLEELSQEAHVDLAELVAIERDPQALPESRTVQHLAQVLKLPAAKLMELAGLAEVCDESLTEAAIRFAARSEPSDRLSPAEQEVLRDFVKALSTNGGR